MQVNQNGDPIEETLIAFPSELTGDDLAQAVLLIVDRMGLELWLTNATKSGNTKLELREGS